MLESNKSQNPELQRIKIIKALDKSGLYEKYPIFEKLYSLFEDKKYEDWKLVTFSCNVLKLYINQR
jgi:hypothetical protein